MIDDTFVCDAVCHYVNFHDYELMTANFYSALTKATGNIRDFTVFEGEDAEPFPPETDGNVDAWYDIVFNQSPTDMIMVGNLPFWPDANLSHPYKVRDDSWAIARDHPDRVLFGGGVEPTAHGLKAALEEMEFQVLERGARSMKFYPFTWKCDDKQIAYPMYEKAQALGVKVLQFHKNLPPDSSLNVEFQAPNDLQNPCRDFPDMTFVLHHPMYGLYFDETVNIASRFPNLHVQLSPLVHQALIAPRLAQKGFGRLLQEVGSEKLLYGTEGPIVGNPSGYIEALMNLEIPADLRDGYAFPQVTQEDKENILGLNFARMFGIDVEEKKRELAGATSVDD
jgi:uncharacterized protein